MSRTPARLLVVFLALAALKFCWPAVANDPEPPGRDFESRKPAQRRKLLQEGGGTARSEKAVADGLHWLALHQAQNGRWTLHELNSHARTAPLPAGKVVPDDAQPMTRRRNDIAGTAFALLPFLAAGITHKAPAVKPANDYHPVVAAGLKWLLSKQSKAGRDKGYFGGDSYSHGLATIAVCEAYGMTSDATLKASAQLAIDYIVSAQDLTGGGWRYAPRQAGDLSVTGFMLSALKTGERAGLRVPRATIKKAERFVDSCEAGPLPADKGGYGYTPGGGGVTPALTAVGALCRQYLGMASKDPSMKLSVGRIKQVAPGSGNIYYEYYATQVMYNLGGEAWDFWNLGSGKKGKGIRDLLIEKQDDGARRKGNKGSWAGTDDIGGRLGATSFSLLMLQVYYRYPRLYKKQAVKP
jgi:hypothetical protein